MCYLITFKSTGILPVIDGHSSANSELPNFSNDSFLLYLQSFVLVRKLQKEVGRHFECSVRGVRASKYLPSMRSKNFKKVGTENRGSSTHWGLLIYLEIVLVYLRQSTTCLQKHGGLWRVLRHNRSIFMVNTSGL